MDDRGEVGGRIPPAPLLCAHRSQHAAAAGESRAIERVDPGLRDDGVEHDPRDMNTVGQGVALSHEGSVGDSIQRQPGVAQRGAQLVDVGDRL
jgi:hypothetical protein